MNNYNLKFQIQYHFTLVPSTIKYLGINVMKHVQDLYEENYKTLIKKIKAEKR